jgi:hypothetical protein
MYILFFFRRIMAGAIKFSDFCGGENSKQTNKTKAELIDVM